GLRDLALRARRHPRRRRGPGAGVARAARARGVERRRDGRARRPRPRLQGRPGTAARGAPQPRWRPRGRRSPGSLAALHARALARSVAEAVRDRHPAVASEGARRDADAWRSLAPLVLGKVDESYHLLDVL